MYKHHWVNGRNIALPAGKVVCVGRNYAEHARELNNPIPEEPLLFIKPSTALASLRAPVALPKGLGDVHYEVEIAILIGKSLKSAAEHVVGDAIAGIGVGLDLTLRDLQNRLKSNGHPWERAKAFDGACPLSEFVLPTIAEDWQTIPLRLSIDGVVRQEGISSQMLFGILPLISHISQYFTLLPGDVVLTGTPAGVGALATGMRLKVEIPGRLSVSTVVQ